MLEPVDAGDILMLPMLSTMMMITMTRRMVVAVGTNGGLDEVIIYIMT